MMHLEILVEDASGANLLEAIISRLLIDYNGRVSYRIHAYKGVGTISKNLKPGTDASKRILLDQLPRLLRGYGKSLQHQEAAVVVVVDQDSRDCMTLKKEMMDVLAQCNPAPVTLFRIAVEEMEAWLLGDRQNIEKHYPRANKKVLDRYEQDSICGTWELLADAIYPGGARKLKEMRWPHAGQAKNEWAKRLGPELSIQGNVSKSFQVFCDGIRRLANQSLEQI